MLFRQSAFALKGGEGADFAQSVFLDADRESVWLIIECYVESGLLIASKEAAHEEVNMAARVFI